MESTLVIVLAETRAHEHTYPLFKSNLLDVYRADLCLCVANNEREDLNNPFYQNAKYVWTYDEPDDWGDAFDHVHKARGYRADWERLLEIKDQWLGGIRRRNAQPGSAGILLFFRLFLKECLIKYRVVNGYDRFVVTRSDFVHPVPQIPLAALDARFIWIPDGEDYGGFTDRHIVVSRRDIVDVLSIADDVVGKPEELHTEMQHRQTWNLEQYIKFAFERRGLLERVKRYPYVMYSVRTAGGHTRWKKGVFSERYGYFIKYEREYRGSQIASRIIRSERDWGRGMIRLLGALISLDRRLHQHREESLLWRGGWWCWDHVVLEALTLAAAAFIRSRRTPGARS